MTEAFDPRIVRVTLDLPSGKRTFEDLAIFAQGTKFASAIQSSCQLRLYNLTREDKNYILTWASPLKLKRTPVNMVLEVGRKSYGTFRLFEGQVLACNPTQPPDVGIILRSFTNNFQTNVILGSSQAAQTDLKTIAQGIATRNGLTLDYQATSKQIENYTANGAVAAEVKKLNLMGGVLAWVDGNTLVVIDANKAKAGDTVLINTSTGMVGVPEVTDSGVNVRMMINNSIQLGRKVKVESKINPAANGTYALKQINFDVANREQPFWYILQCSNLAYYQGTL